MENMSVLNDILHACVCICICIRICVYVHVNVGVYVNGVWCMVYDIW